MSEKRFKAYGNNFIAIDDNVENKTYYLNEDVDRIVDLLNSLVEENEKLKSGKRDDAKEFSALFKQNMGLKIDNEQLRKQCFELEKDYLIETSDISDKIYLKDEINELKKRYGVKDE